MPSPTPSARTLEMARSAEIRLLEMLAAREKKQGKNAKSVKSQAQSDAKFVEQALRLQRESSSPPDDEIPDGAFEKIDLLADDVSALIVAGRRRVDSDTGEILEDEILDDFEAPIKEPSKNGPPIDLITTAPVEDFMGRYKALLSKL